MGLLVMLNVKCSYVEGMMELENVLAGKIVIKKS
jgi:hypothetical protein